MRSAVILQVRVGSTRLPRKALLPLSGRSMGFRAMEALKLVKADAHVLATDDESAPFLAGDAEEAGFIIVIGPREDVLRRYRLAVEAAGADTFFRATGDNPLVSHELANELAARHGGDGADYAAYAGLPLGAGVELVKSAALFAADAEAVDPYEREHVCPFLYRRPERFRISRPEAPQAFRRPELSFTVDTRDDYEKVKALFEALYRGAPPSLKDSIAAAGGAA